MKTTRSGSLRDGRLVRVIESSGRRQALDGDAADELALALRGRSPSEFEQRLVSLLHDEIFCGQDDLRMSEACQLAYRRVRYLRSRLQIRAVDLLGDLDDLLALHQWAVLVDSTLATILTIHFNLCMGSILQLGEGRPELQQLLDELECMDSIGVFLATELGYGNNVQALETEAVYDHEQREFVINTPSAQAQKFMPNTGAPGVAKIGVVMARLKVRGSDCGVFPFVVRIRDSEGLCPGVKVTALGDKPGYALDNAVTSFKHVRVPKANWLSGADSKIDENGGFHSEIRTKRQRFLQSMDRVQMGKLCLSGAVVATCCAALQMTLAYASRRKTFAFAGSDVPILSYRTYQQQVFEAVATAYACSFFVQHAKALCVDRGAAGQLAADRALALCKCFVSSRGVQILTQCRERVGAQGMFSRNKIIPYLISAKGVVTAEGDNELLLIKVGREMLLGHEYELPAEGSAVANVGLVESIDCLLSLMRAREGSLLRRIRGALHSAPRHVPTFEVWNEQLPETIELASTYAVRMALEAFAGKLDEIHEPKACHVMERLLRLFALVEIAKFTTPLLVEDLIGREFARRIAEERKRLSAELFTNAALVTEAFQMPTSLLDAPMAEDYVRAYDFLEYESRPESFVQPKATEQEEEALAAS